jgi:thiamine pyrophosphokinase
MFLIKENETAIIKPGKLCLKNEAGLFCFGKSKVSTKGFKWELSKEGSDLEWSKLISSSNVIVGP